jgi:hypothetical protein
LCELRRIALLPCVVALLAAGSAAGQGSAPDLTEAGAANTVTFQDATGEDPQGWDVTSVTVSNDDLGRIKFRIAIPGRPTLTDDMRFTIWIDSDDNRATGNEQNGVDYFLTWDRLGGVDPGLFRCDRSTCKGGRDVVDPAQRTLRFSYDHGPAFSILDAEIGVAKRFRFALNAVSGLVRDPGTKRIDHTNAHFDSAPPLGSFWTYTVRTGPQRLLVKSLATSPSAPRAGALFTVRAAVTRADTGAILSRGRVRCVARIAGRPVDVRSQRYVGKRAACVFGIPPDAAGETIRGTIAVSFGGKKVARAFSARVRS